MIDPTRHRQLEELDQVGLCVKILSMSRNELYLNMRFLDVSLSSLGFEAQWNRNGIATDGFLIYYGPDFLLNTYRQGRVLVNRAYLHMLFHCLFCHMDTRNGRERRLWNLACDIAMESVIDGLYQKCVHKPASMFRRETYLRLKKSGLTVLNGEGIYKKLLEMKLNEKQMERLEWEFYVDDHDLWEQELPKSQLIRRQNLWKENREKMQTEMETTGSKDQSEDSRDLFEQVQVENRERYDYRSFLRKFAVLKEEIQVDPDSFDPVFYTYGLELYGNMPLVEPLETKEVYRVEDFAIVIDTSMSCSGELVRRFLEETYSVLSSSESYFRKVNIHIIQCDEKIQSDVVIEKEADMKEYMEHFTIAGHGGTDFRPAFEYVRGLQAEQKFTHLRGLIYFTDGKGIYPAQKPPFDTVFVFMEENYSDISVPGWAMKLILTEEDLGRTL
ncbi:MAG: VWA-like domain-containing protein [Lachnospiraceae bacterium]|nr:VWA-like domain-containing protein [Lachnospiraceae bacterium]